MAIFEATDIYPQSPAHMSSERIYRTLAWTLLVGLTVLVVVGLALPLLMPLGAMNWDTYLYLDGSYRIHSGQMPAVDFFAPIGPLAYYLVAFLQWLFPNAQPILLASWSVLLVTIPAMALITAETARRSAVVAICLVVPFAVYSFLPFNTSAYYPYPASDGFGIYNRHGAQLLFVLTAALLFVRDQRVMAGVIALLMFAMFGVKVTAFVSAGILCAWALLSGRVTILTAIASAAVSLVAIGAVELATGMISAYVSDVLLLVEMNAGVLATRLLQSASRTAGTTLTAFAMIVFLAGIFLVWSSRQDERVAPGFVQRVRELADTPVAWLAVALFSGVLFESQNTGSQELIQLWPVVLYALFAMRRLALPTGVAVAGYVLAASVALTPLVQTFHHSARAIGTMLKQDATHFTNLKTMNAVVVRDRMVERAERLEKFYLEYPQANRAITDAGELHSFLLYSDMDFQYGLLKHFDEVVGKLKQLEESGGWKFDTVMSLEFTNPFPWLLDKTPPKHISIGADPYRTVPPLDAETAAAVRDTDVVLESQCPYYTSNKALYEVYAPALTKHRKVQVTPCYVAYIRDGVDG